MEITLHLPDDLFPGATPEQLKQQAYLYFAVSMYRESKLPLDAACELSGLERADFLAFCERQKHLVVLDDEMRQMIAGAISEVDPVQMEIYSRMTPAERFRQGCDLSTLAHQVGRYRRSQQSR
jgi:hypothetical protein